MVSSSFLLASALYTATPLLSCTCKAPAFLPVLLFPYEYKTAVPSWCGFVPFHSSVQGQAGKSCGLQWSQREDCGRPPQEPANEEQEGVTWECSRLGVKRFDFGAQNEWSGLRSQEFVKCGLTLNLLGGWQNVECFFSRRPCRITVEEFLRRTEGPSRLR